MAARTLPVRRSPLDNSFGLHRLDRIEYAQVFPANLLKQIFSSKFFYRRHFSTRRMIRMKTSLTGLAVAALLVAGSSLARPCPALPKTRPLRKPRSQRHPLRRRRRRPTHRPAPCRGRRSCRKPPSRRADAEPSRASPSLRALSPPPIRLLSDRVLGAVPDHVAALLSQPHPLESDSLVCAVLDPALEQHQPVERLHRRSHQRRRDRQHRGKARKACRDKGP